MKTKLLLTLLITLYGVNFCLSQFYIGATVGYEILIAKESLTPKEPTDFRIYNKPFPDYTLTYGLWGEKKISDKIAIRLLLSFAKYEMAGTPLTGLFSATRFGYNRFQISPKLNRRISQKFSFDIGVDIRILSNHFFVIQNPTELFERPELDNYQFGLNGSLNYMITKNIGISIDAVKGILFANESNYSRYMGKNNTLALSASYKFKL